MSIVKLSNLKVNNKEPQVHHLDINADFAQTFGPYTNTHEDNYLPYVSSANVACGGHAGDPLTILNSLHKIKDHKLALGAHIGYQDIVGFGYRDMVLSYEELRSMVLYQLGGLQALAKSLKMEIEYVKPHGALYRKISICKETAVHFAQAVKSYDPWLPVIAPHGQIASIVTDETGINLVQEFHPGQEYDDNGNTQFMAAPKERDIKNLLKSVEMFVRESKIISNSGKVIDSQAKTIYMSSSENDSLQIIRYAKELIGKPVPITVALVAKTGWI